MPLNEQGEDPILYPSYPVIALAEQILRMGDEIYRLRVEAREGELYRRKYFDLLNETLAHNNTMSGIMLTAALDGAFTKNPISTEISTS